MPSHSIPKDLLFKAIGKTFTDEEFSGLCFDYGLELDNVTENSPSNRFANGCEHSESFLGGTSQPLITYKIEVPANRYDLLCLEGLSRALRIFLRTEKPPIYKTLNLKKTEMQVMYVDEHIREIRPYVVCAILRGMEFTQDRYERFIDLQEKLHQNICRQRTLVAIGTHDLDTLQGPFRYTARAPQDIHFIPLNQQTSMNGHEIMQFYQNDQRLRKFLSIIQDKPRYPVIYDQKETVLSLPPIINSDHSKIRLTTRNLFIECTATDFTKAHIVLNTMVTMFSEYCKEKFVVEPVRIVDEHGQDVYCTPDLSCRILDVPVEYIRSRISRIPTKPQKGEGVPQKLSIWDISAEEICGLLESMCLDARPLLDPTSMEQDCAPICTSVPHPSSASQVIRVQIPPTRSDILHPCDIMEDTAIAFGFNQIELTWPPTNTIGQPFLLNKLTDHLRNEMAQMGYTEILTLSLLSHAENFEYMRREDHGKEAVLLANPKTLEYQVARSHLLPGLLKTILHNKGTALPIKVFEISDIVLKDASQDVGARNERHLCVLHYGGSGSGFEFIHGVLDRLMLVLNVPFFQESSHLPENQDVPRSSTGDLQRTYCIRPSQHPSFFPGRSVEILYGTLSMGTFGIIHPEVLEKFDLSFPCSALEMNIEPFL